MNMAEAFLIRLGEKGWCILAGWIRRDDTLSFFRYRPEILTLNLWLLVGPSVFCLSSQCIWVKHEVCLLVGYFITLMISEDIITLTLLSEKRGSHKSSYQITMVWFIFMRTGCLVVHYCLQLIRTFSDDTKGDNNCECHPWLYWDQCRTHLQEKKKIIKTSIHAGKQNPSNTRHPSEGPEELTVLSNLCPPFLWAWNYDQHLEPPSKRDSISAR